MDTREKIPRILIVEDEALIAWSVSNALRKAGFAVTIVESGTEAIRIMRLSQFDVILTDLKLPSIDGYQVAQGAKQIVPDIPVLMMSAAEDMTMRGRSAGGYVDCFIEKPFNLNDIILLVSQHIGKNLKVP